MSIRPIDFQTLVPKVSEQTRVQNENLQRDTSMQQQQAEMAAKDAQDNTATVHQQNDTEKAGIYDKENKQQNKKKKRSKDGTIIEETLLEHEQLLKKKNTLKQPNEGRTIDVRL